MNTFRTLFKDISVSQILSQFRNSHHIVRETPWKNVYLRRFGYRDPFFKRPDTLPRIKEDHKYLKVGARKFSKHRPLNLWNDKRKYFGQNDYIDILGDGSIHPVKLLNNMPPWLRGFQGNEFQMLLKKQIAYAHWRWSKPCKWRNMNKRVMYLYRYLNWKTKTP